MARVARAIAGVMKPEALPSVTTVPIPPSKQRTHPEYDPRMADIARQISPVADVREPIETVADRFAVHESEQRLKPHELIAKLRLQQALLFATDAER